MFRLGVPSLEEVGCVDFLRTVNGVMSVFGIGMDDAKDIMTSGSLDA